MVPGTILKMPQGSYIYASPTGILIAEGTPERPIVFTSIDDDSIGGDSNNNLASTSPVPGQWESIYLDSSGSSLQNVEVRYAGNVSNAGHGHEPYRVASINVRNEAAPSIRNTRIRFGENVGLRMEANTRPLLDNLRIENSGREAIQQVLSAEPIYSGVQFLDNFADRITLGGGTISKNRTLDFNRLPVFVNDDLTIAQDANVQLVAGSIFKFTAGNYFWVRGGLQAEGTADAPIVFTSIYDDAVGGDSDGLGNSAQVRPGQWQGFYIDSSNTTLNFVDIRYAGNDASPGHGYDPYRVPSLTVRNGSEPQIHNTRILYGENVGLQIENGAKPLLDNLTVELTGHYNVSGREAIVQDLNAQPIYQGIHLQATLPIESRCTVEPSLERELSTSITFLCMSMTIYSFLQPQILLSHLELP